MLEYFRVGFELLASQSAHKAISRSSSKIVLPAGGFLNSSKH